VWLRAPPHTIALSERVKQPHHDPDGNPTLELPASPPPPILRDNTCPFLSYSLRGCVYLHKAPTQPRLLTCTTLAIVAIVAHTTRNSSPRRLQLPAACCLIPTPANLNMTAHQRLLDWLDDLCVRFIVNAPHEELQSVERICFQLEEAQWYYEDFIRPLDPGLPSMNLRVFASRMFAHCPLFSNFSPQHAEEAYETFIQYKTRVPVRGAIMLNEDMTHAVLVKGWKKGAKWSFPRGKINKEEKDLDCAIREVYEETGFDLKESGLVPLEEDVKSISVNMHQQNVMLFVFRGVPMDTHFEPRTRKEISKIDWYKLGDLPHLKHKNKPQQGNGQDLVKDSSFYMVGPFIGQLKGWIKQQKRLDRIKVPIGQHLAPPMANGPGATDTEDLEADMGETTADESGLPESKPNDGTFADLVARLGRSHRTSDALPEVSTQTQPEEAVDPAAELKRLLSVGTGFPSQGGPSDAHAPVNPLLDMLQRGNQPAPQPESLPRTPFEQLISTPQQPQSPHGQHHPRPQYVGQMGPPPSFPFHSPQRMPYGGPQYPPIPPLQHNGYPGPIPHQFPPPPHHMNPNFSPRPPMVHPPFHQPPPRPMEQTGNPLFADSPQHHGPHGPPASKLPPPKLTAHTLGLLNAFKLNEKPAISSPQGSSQPEQNLQATPKTQQPPPLHRAFDSFVSPSALQNAHSYAPSPPAFRSPPPKANFEPVQPKPRNAHQDSLLNLFRSPSMAAPTPPPHETPEQPVELSAYPSTPGYARPNDMPNAEPPVPNLNTKPADLLDSFWGYSLQQNQSSSLQPNRPGQTSATVRGPVNAPDFDTVKKNSQYPTNGHSRGPSPALPKQEQKVFIPQQMLKQENMPSAVQSPLEMSASATSSPLTVVPPTKTFKPHILKRPEQSSPAAIPVPTAHTQGLLGLFKSPSPAPTQPIGSVATAARPAQSQELLDLFKSKNQTSSPPPPVTTTVAQASTSGPSMHSQGLLNLFKSPTPSQAAQPSPAAAPAPLTQISTLPTDQKTALLSLFSKPSSHANSPILPTKSPLAPPSAPKSPLTATSPIPPSRSPQPSPTPKTQMSGIISPVSPLPDKGSQAGSPAHLTSRSRISSLGDSMPPNIVIPRSEPSAGPTTKIGGGDEGGYVSSGSLGLGELGIGDKGKGKVVDNGGKSPVDKTFLLGFLNDVARKGR
jgi:mRNA-decapping enzyme subunit 2